MRIHPFVLRFGLLTGVAALLAGCAECTQMILGKGDLSNARQPYGDWATASAVKLSAADPSRLEAVPGTGVIYNGPSGRTSDLFTTADYGDVKVHYEYNIAKGSNSGVYFMGRYEVQIFDSYGVKDPKSADNGAIYERWENERGFEGHPPLVNASKPPGEWQSVDVLFRAPRFDKSGKKVENARFKRVVLNGAVVQENVEVTGPTRASHFQDEKMTGPLMAQGDHGPVAFRNIRVTPEHLP